MELAIGDVVQNTTVSFNRDYPNHTGVIESVAGKSGGLQFTVEYTVEVESMSPRCRKIAAEMGVTDDYMTFTTRTPARSLREIG